MFLNFLLSMFCLHYNSLLFNFLILLEHYFLAIDSEQTISEIKFDYPTKKTSYISNWSLNYFIIQKTILPTFFFFTRSEYNTASGVRIQFLTP